MVVKRKYALTPVQALAWAQQYSKVQNYLSKLNVAKKERAAHKLWLYCDWAQKSPDELLALKTSFEGCEAEALLDRFVSSNVDVPDSNKYLIVSYVRGFFRVNYRALQPQAGKIEYTVQKTKGVLSKEQRFKLYQACYNPRDKCLIMLGLTTAIARESYASIRFSYFEYDWMRIDTPSINLPPECLKGHGRGKYRNTRQVTFLTPEAKRCLIEYREWFSKLYNHVWREDDYVFQGLKNKEVLNTDGVADAVGRVARRAGVAYALHDGRRIVQTALENVSCPNNWIKKVKGRKCSGEEAPYSRPAIEQLREFYRRALPELEFLGEQYKVADDLSVEDRKIMKTIIEAMKAGKISFNP